MPRRRPPVTTAPPQQSMFTFFMIAMVVAAAVLWSQQQQHGEEPRGDRGAQQQLQHAAREQQWSYAETLVVSRRAAPFRGLLVLTMAARSMSSLHGDTSLAGVCTGRCTDEDPVEEAFESWLHLLAQSRHTGWEMDVADALFAAVRSRHLRALEILCEGFQSAPGIGASLQGAPLLQLAVTTRAEVAAICRILLLSDRAHARRVRLLGWLRGMGHESAAVLADALAEGGPIRQVAARAVADAWSARFIRPLRRLGLNPLQLDDVGENAVHVAALCVR
jgi:hypothetical protein